VVRELLGAPGNGLKNHVRDNSVLQIEGARLATGKWCFAHVVGYFASVVAAVAENSRVAGPECPRAYRSDRAAQVRHVRLNMFTRSHWVRTLFRARIIRRFTRTRANDK
jgi:hypothetical protein